ncbi:MAG TPA: DUF2262 domain-containing protein [Burkholderiaceae bacterium]|nr:DUF2262 domain-containing protein [Burkholderiaceae bacterium]
MLNRFKQLINLTLTDEPRHAVDHPILGRLAPLGDDQSTLVGVAPCGARSVALRVTADDSELAAALELATSAVQSLLVLDARARKLVSDASLKSYNDEWRFGTSLLADGSAREFEKPALSEEAFCAQLELAAIEANGASCLTFSYTDGGLFWGHSHYVCSFDGLAMQDVNVSMLG